MRWKRLNSTLCSNFISLLTRGSFELLSLAFFSVGWESGNSLRASLLLLPSTFFFLLSTISHCSPFISLHTPRERLVCRLQWRFDSHKRVNGVWENKWNTTDFTYRARSVVKRGGSSKSFPEENGRERKKKVFFSLLLFLHFNSFYCRSCCCCGTLYDDPAAVVISLSLRRIILNYFL